jgi:hypothetical protein
MTDAPMAPELVTSHWFNSESAITLDALRGEVIVIEASQMLCPGCVTHGLPWPNGFMKPFVTRSRFSGSTPSSSITQR